MSGGSMDYLCYKVSDAANDLANSRCPRRKAFGIHLRLVAEALHDIEWVDSADKSRGDEIEAIMKVISKEEVLLCSIEQAQETMNNLQKLIDEIRGEL